MTSWLRELPHEIPFRAVSSIGEPEEESVSGAFLSSFNDAGAGLSPELWLVEAMAQAAGRLAFGTSGAPGQLVSVDRFTLDAPFETGDRLDLEIRARAALGGLHRFEAIALRGETRIASATLTLGRNEVRP